MPVENEKRVMKGWVRPSKNGLHQQDVSHCKPHLESVWCNVGPLKCVEVSRRPDAG